MNTQMRILSFLFAFLICAGAVFAAEPIFTPLRDDALAQEYAPYIINDDGYGSLLGIYYRAASDSDGNIWLAFHPIWPYERNTASGCSPWLSRSLYTGGIALQRTMFGPGDIEVLVVKLDKNRKPVLVQYETAENYDASAFSVKHKTVTIDQDLSFPLYFRVISWNHLFDLSDAAFSGKGFSLIRSAPVYFSAEDWTCYGMTKEKTGALSKNRAHRAWELPAVEQK
ncbi:MAG: hypothetical protein ACRCUT_02820 [Spirochaetota bacterium]